MHTTELALTEEQLLRIHSLMVQARVIEERLIKMYKSGEGYFWIGGPGEEAFAVPLGLLIQKGQGIQYDYLHLHYRSSATILAMGGRLIDIVRQMKSLSTDPYTAGRNFVNHPAIWKWNVVPVTSPIEVQYAQSLGTAHAQRAPGCTGITIVTGGDAGTAEGDFASALVWATRPAGVLPLLMIVTNNQWGISTAYDGQHGESRISDRGRAFGMRTAMIDGNDVVASWETLKTAIDYVRTTRKPFLLEAKVSRLHGHSSASGANRTEDEDPITRFELRLRGRGMIKPEQIADVWNRCTEKANEAVLLARQEPNPSPGSIFDHVWSDSQSDNGRDTLAESLGEMYGPKG